MNPPVPSVLLLACALGAAAAAAQTALSVRPAASPEATLAPAGPVRVELPPGESRAVVPGTASPAQPAVFLFAVPARTPLTVGVVSKSGAARLSIYEPGSERPLAGTEPAVGAVRWIGQSTAGGELRIVVHTTGEETPVRLEVSIDRHLDFNAPPD